MPDQVLVARVLELEAAGLSQREIGAEVGRSRSYVEHLLRNLGTCSVCGGATSSREYDRCGACRSAQAEGRASVCIDCGGPTSYKAFVRCRTCSGKVGHPSLSIFDAWTPELAYLLGWAFTDGSISVGARYSIGWELADREPLEIIKRIVGTEKKIEERLKPGRMRPHYRLRLNGKPVVEAFMRFGVQPCKTFEMRVPEVPKKVLYHFVRGVIDGDGSIKFHGAARLRVTITSGSPEFLRDLQKLVAGRLYENTAVGHACWVLTFNDGHAKRLLEKVYADSEGLRLTRKYEKWRSLG